MARLIDLVVAVDDGAWLAKIATTYTTLHYLLIVLNYV